MTDMKPTPAPPATSALVPVAAGVEFNLDAFPTAQFNRLIPIQTIRMPGDLFVPVVQIVQMDPADSQGKSDDHYKSNDVPAGRRALTARGLNKVASASSVSFFDERRTDDGSDPNVMAVSVMASMTLPTGLRITAPGSQLIDIRSWFGPTTSAAEIAKFRKQFYANVSTRAKNRAIRGLLSMKSSYTDAEIAKPFAAVSFSPNMANPEVRARFLDAMAPAVAQLYGPEAAPQLQAGQVVQLREVDDSDDGVIDGHATDAGPELSWFGTEAAPVPTAAPANDRSARLAAILREKAASSGMVGPATAPQLQKLAEVFVAKGITRPETDAGLRIIFGVTGRADFLGSQAQALIEASVDAEFGDLWRELVAGDGAQAG